MWLLLNTTMLTYSCFPFINLFEDTLYTPQILFHTLQTAPIPSKTFDSISELLMHNVICQLPNNSVPLVITLNKFKESPLEQIRPLLRRPPRTKRRARLPPPRWRRKNYFQIRPTLLEAEMTSTRELPHEPPWCKKHSTNTTQMSWRKHRLLLDREREDGEGRRRMISNYHYFCPPCTVHWIIW